MRQPDEPGDEALAVVLDQLARTVDVGQAQRAGAHAEHVVVHEMVVLARRLVDAVDVRRLHEVLFGHRQLLGSSVHLARAREDHLHARVVAAARLEDRELAAAVDLEIRVGILHAVDVAHLAREIEDHLLVAHQVIHRARLAHVGDVDADAVFDVRDIEQVAAVFWNEGIDDEHARAELDELMRERAADEPEPAGDHHAAVAIEGAVVGAAAGDARSVIAWLIPAARVGLIVGLRNRTGVPCRPRPRTTRVIHSFSTSMPGPEDAAEVEELRAAVGAVVVVDRHLGDREAGVLDLAHHLEADDACVPLQPHAIEDLATHQPEVAIDVPHAQPEQALHGVVIDAPDRRCGTRDPIG